MFLAATSWIKSSMKEALKAMGKDVDEESTKAIGKTPPTKNKAAGEGVGKGKQTSIPSSPEKKESSGNSQKIRTPLIPLNQPEFLHPEEDPLPGPDQPQMLPKQRQRKRKSVLENEGVLIFYLRM